MQGCLLGDTVRQLGNSAAGAMQQRSVRVGGCGAVRHNGSSGRRSVVVFAADGQKRKRGKKRGQQIAGQEEGAVEDTTFSLDSVNPFVLGQRSRALFDDVWQQFTKLGSPVQSVNLDDEFATLATLDDLKGGVFETPQASYTTVLVVGATGRVGRILLRKLLLRGYKVRALVRKRADEASTPATESIPQSVQVVYGDVGDYEACRKAVQGVDKVLCCISARSDLTSDLSRVEEQGVYNLGKAMMDHLKKLERAGAIKGKTKKRIADSRDPASFSSWKIERLGLVEGSAAARRIFDRGQDISTVEVNEESGQLVFKGVVRSRGGIAEASGDLKPVYDGESLANCEGLLLRLGGDGNQYTVTLVTEDNALYSAKLNTRAGYQTARLPFNTFRPVNTDAPLDVAALSSISLRFEPRVGRPAVVVGNDDLNKADEKKGEFMLTLDFIKALPGGQEPEFILVSCAGAPKPGQDPALREKRLAYKRRGEAKLRNSGLGYTIIRPGPLVEEPGGYRALVFDQGNRISQGISYADAADVALKALHDPLARNKAFEVCYEYTPEAGLEMYELVAHLPDKANNYLSPALATLEKNT